MTPHVLQPPPTPKQLVKTGSHRILTNRQTIHVNRAQRPRVVQTHGRYATCGKTSFAFTKSVLPEAPDALIRRAHASCLCQHQNLTHRNPKQSRFSQNGASRAMTLDLCNRFFRAHNLSRRRHNLIHLSPVSAVARELSALMPVESASTSLDRLFRALSTEITHQVRKTSAATILWK